MLAPVVLFVYERPDHTRRTIESLAENYLASETEVYIFSDAARSKEVIDKVKAVREYVDALPLKRCFKSVTIKKAKENRGLANSVILGVTEVIEKYGRVIVLEDDLVSAVDFLQFMNSALDYYETDDEIWSISGYSFRMKIPRNYNSDIYLSFRACSWGWATWKDRWETVDWNVSDYNEFRRNRRLRRAFNRGGRDMAAMLDEQMKGTIDSWAIRWCYAQSRSNKLTVYPVVSRIRNIGLDGTGTHNSRLTPFYRSRYDTILSDGTKECQFGKPGLNKRIARKFRSRYGTSAIWSIKRCIKRMMIVFRRNR